MARRYSHCSLMRESPLIVHIVNRLDTGGMENGLLNLVNEMAPELFQHAIIALSGVTAFATVCGAKMYGSTRLISVQDRTLAHTCGCGSC